LAKVAKRSLVVVGATKKIKSISALSKHTFKKLADAVIVGSSLVSFVEKYNKNKAKMLASVGVLANEISKAIKE
jgi:tryptophan synthase alpha subunit